MIIFKRMDFRIFLQHTELVCAFMWCGNTTLNDGELSVNGEEAICPLPSLFLPPFFFPVHCRDGFWCWQQTVCKAAEGQAPHMFSVASGSAKLGFIPTSMQFICSYCQKPLLYVWVVIHLNNLINTPWKWHSFSHGKKDLMLKVESNHLSLRVVDTE